MCACVCVCVVAYVFVYERAYVRERVILEVVFCMIVKLGSREICFIFVYDTTRYCMYKLSINNVLFCSMRQNTLINAYTQQQQQ